MPANPTEYEKDTTNPTAYTKLTTYPTEWEIQEDDNSILLLESAFSLQLEDGGAIILE